MQGRKTDLLRPPLSLLSSPANVILDKVASMETSSMSNVATPLRTPLINRWKCSQDLVTTFSLPLSHTRETPLFTYTKPPACFLKKFCLYKQEINWVLEVEGCQARKHIFQVWRGGGSTAATKYVCLFCWKKEEEGCVCRVGFEFYKNQSQRGLCISHNSIFSGKTHLSLFTWVGRFAGIIQPNR